MSIYDECKTFGLNLNEIFVEEDSKTNVYSDFNELKSKLLSVDFEKNVILNQYFPSTLDDQTVELDLEGPVVLQISSPVKISVPFIDRKNDDTQPRLLSFQISDGHKKVNVVEVEHLGDISTSVAKGAKILFLGGKVINGKLGLTSINSQFLGGKVSHLFKQSSVDASQPATVETITQRAVELSQGAFLDPSNFAVKPTSHFSVLSLPSLEVFTPKPVTLTIPTSEASKTAGPTLSIAEILAKARAAVPTTGGKAGAAPAAAGAASSWYQPVSPKDRKPIVKNIKPDQSSSTRQQISEPALRKLNSNVAGARQPRVEPPLRTHYAIEAPQDARRDTRQDGRGGRGAGRGDRGEPAPRFQKEREPYQRANPRESRDAPANRRDQAPRPPASSGIVYSATPPQSSGIVYSTTAPTAKSKPGSIRPNNNAPPPGINSQQPKSGITYSATPPVPAGRSSGIVYSSTPPVQSGSRGGKAGDRHRDDRDQVDYSDNNRRGGDRGDRNERVPREYSSRNGTQYAAEPVPDFAQDPRRERTPRERLPAKDLYDANRERTPRERLPEKGGNSRQSAAQEVRYVDSAVEPPRGAARGVDRVHQSSNKDVDASQESGSLSQRIAQAVAQPVAAHFVQPELRQPEPAAHRQDSRAQDREAPRRNEERPRFQDSRHEPSRQDQRQQDARNDSRQDRQQEPRHQDARDGGRGGQDARGGQDQRGQQQQQDSRGQDRFQQQQQDSRHSQHDNRREEPRREAGRPVHQGGGQNNHHQQQQQQHAPKAPVVPVVVDHRTAEERIASELEKIDQQRRQKREQSRGGGGGGGNFQSAPMSSLFENTHGNGQDMPEPPMRELQPFFAAGQYQDAQPIKAVAPAQLQRFQPAAAVSSPVSPPAQPDWKSIPNNPHQHQQHQQQPPHYAAPQDRHPVHQQQEQPKVASRPPFNAGPYNMHDDRSVPAHHEAPRPVPDAGGKVMGISQENIQRILEQQNREAQQQQRMAAPQPASRGQFAPNRLFNNALSQGVDRQERGGLRGGGGRERDDEQDYPPQQQQQASHHQQATHHHQPPQHQQQQQQQGRGGGDDRQQYGQYNDHQQYSQQQQQHGQQQQHWH